MKRNFRLPKSLFFMAVFCSLMSFAKGEASHCSAKKFKTQTPIKYLVVIIPENCSFDHLFGTYPRALNPLGEPCFRAKKNTPTVNGLTKALFNHNTNASPPFRLDRSQAMTSEPAHHYTQLQQEAHGGLLDQFVQVNSDDITSMGYYDGNTVTALWNYAQRFAMSDNCFSTNMAPSTPGHVNLISGLTHGAIPSDLILGSGEIVTVDGTLIGDPDPVFDACSKPPTVELTGRNIGNLLNEKNITWGYFQGGFGDCSKTHIGSNGLPVADYSPHHEPFQYYRSTSNPNHLPPSSIENIGYQDQANHQYDLENFWAAVNIHNTPAVSFIKPPAYQDGHPIYSDQLLFQFFLVNTLNRLQFLPEWKHMAVVVIWDDSGGWYDHVMPSIINQSHTSADALLSPGDAGNPPPGAYQGRLGYGMRVPLLVISPYAKSNYVDHSLIDQTSVLRFIEDNWQLGRIGDQSFDAVAGSLKNMFKFHSPHKDLLILQPETGLKKR